MPAPTRRSFFCNGVAKIQNLNSPIHGRIDLLAETCQATGDTLTLRFRVARRFGYGVSAGMMRRCLERLDEEGIPGVLRLLNVLCDTDPVGTQGPVWRVGGRSV